MKPLFVLGASSLAAIVMLGAGSPAGAGAFTYETGCDTLGVSRSASSSDSLSTTLTITALCEIRVEPTSYYGVPINPIIDCLAPSWLSCSADAAAGTATFVTDNCLPIWFSDSLGIVVEAPRGHYWARLVTTGGYVRTSDLLQYDCAAPLSVGGIPLESNFVVMPNPARTPRVSFGLPLEADVELAVHDVAGRQVALLARGRFGARAYSREWDGRDCRGHGVPSGVYFYRLKVGAQTRVIRGIKLD